MNNKIKETINILKLSIPFLIAIYRFGSSLNGLNNKESDIDLAFLSNSNIDNLRRWKIQEEIASLLNRNIDLIDLKKASDVMRFEIISTGKRIYVKGIMQAEVFEDLVYSLYLDLNEQRKYILEDIKQRLTVYG